MKFRALLETTVLSPAQIKAKTEQATKEAVKELSKQMLDSIFNGSYSIVQALSDELSNKYDVFDEDISRDAIGEAIDKIRKALKDIK